MKRYLLLFITFLMCQPVQAEQIIDFSELSCVKEHGKYICLGKDLKPYTGIAQSKYSDGTLKNILNYKDGKQDGEQKLYNEKGYLVFEHIFKNGDCFETTAYSEKGNIINKSSYPSSFPNIGKSIDYYDNGKVKRIKDYNNDIFEAYDEDGNPKNGTLEFYDSNGEVQEIKNYKEGKEDGLQKHFYDSKRLMGEYSAQNGKQDGILVIYGVNGVMLRKCLFEQGIKKWCKTKEELDKVM